MSMYLGKYETSHAVTEALDLLQKYPHQWITYRPNDPLSNSVITYLKKEGKVVVNRFHQYRAAPSYRKNPSPGLRERSDRLHKMRLTLLKKVKRAERSESPSIYNALRHKLLRLDGMIHESAATFFSRKRAKRNPAPPKNSRSAKFHRMRAALLTQLEIAGRKGSFVLEQDIGRKLNKLDRMFRDSLTSKRRK